MNPLVSVILPAYNAEKTLYEAVDSIIKQTYKNWELLLINDGSKDGTDNIAKLFEDKRIRYIQNDGNKGLIYTLNRGIGLSNGKYILRMDADDISLSHRIQLQVDYMENHPETIVCGGFIKTIGEGVKSEIKKYFTHSDDIKKAYPLYPPFAHPTVIIRKNILDKTGIGYDIEYKDAEDYKMWLDLMDYGEYHNIAEVLLNYRISSTQCTNPNNETMMKSSQKCRYLYAKNVLGEEIAESLKETTIGVRQIMSIKRTKNKYLLESAYYSMSIHNVSLLLLYFIIGDVFRYPKKTTYKVLRRFAGLKKDIY